MKRSLLAGLFVALLAIPAGLAQAQDCPLEGNAVRQAVRDANVLKNRETAPADNDIDQNVTLAAMVEPGEDQDRFSNDQAASIVGWVVNVKPGGKETVNCGATDLADRDTHIEIALSRNAPETERVIVEVTPGAEDVGVGGHFLSLARPHPTHWLADQLFNPLNAAILIRERPRNRSGYKGAIVVTTAEARQHAVSIKLALLEFAVVVIEVGFIVTESLETAMHKTAFVDQAPIGPQ